MYNMKLGFFGGSFNPPTYAHLNIAKSVIKEMKLDKFYFVPMGNNYKKKDLIDENSRLEMLKIICNNEEKIDVSSIELNKKEKIETYQAFEMIKNRYKNDEIFFIMGADNFEKIPSWTNSERLMSSYKYVIINRNNINIEKVIKNNKIMKNNIKNFDIIDIKEEYKTISSSKVRDLLHEKRLTSVKDYIPDEILSYIIKNKIWS